MIYVSLAFWHSELSTLTHNRWWNEKEEVKETTKGNTAFEKTSFSRCVVYHFNVDFELLLLVRWNTKQQKMVSLRFIFFFFFFVPFLPQNVYFVHVNALVFIPLSLPSSSCAKTKLGILFTNNIHLHILRWYRKKNVGGMVLVARNKITNKYICHRDKTFNATEFSNNFTIIITTIIKEGREEGAVNIKMKRNKILTKKCVPSQKVNSFSGSSQSHQLQ